MTAGLDKRVRLFAVDGGDNPLAQSVHFGDLPVRRAAFDISWEMPTDGWVGVPLTLRLPFNTRLRFSTPNAPKSPPGSR